MFSEEKFSIDKNELEKRRIEIKMQIKVLVDELEIIELKLTQNFGSKKKCLDNHNSNSQQNNSNSQTQNSNNANRDSKLEYEEGQTESKNFVNNLDSIQKDNIIFYDINLTKFDKLKHFFQSTWDVDFIKDYEIPQSIGSVSKREIAAFKKMRYFIIGDYIDHYENKIRIASLKQEDYYLPPDQLQAAIENILNAMIVRSKVLELYDKCGVEAGKLENSSSNISILQIYCNNNDDLKCVIYNLFDNLKYITWNFEKLKALFELWQGCSIGRYYDECNAEESGDFNKRYASFLNLLKIKDLELTEQEREILISILQATHNFGKR